MQDGVLSRHQASTLGIDRHLIARRIAAQRWQTVGPHVVVLHHGPLFRAQQEWAAVLHGGEGSALFGLSALISEGLRGLETPVVHVVAPHGRGRRDLESGVIRVRVHESLRLDASVVHPVRLPRRQRVVRAAVDAASDARSDGACRAILAAVVQQRLARAEQLRSEIVSRPTVPRRALILETADDLVGGAHSLPEMQWSAGIRRYGLPEPTRQQVVRHASGLNYLDADFDLWGVTVEINGSQHLDLLAREADDERRFILSVGGRLVVDIASYVVRHDIERAVLRTARALWSRGWEPDRLVMRRLHRLAAARGEQLWLDSAQAAGLRRT